MSSFIGHGLAALTIGKSLQTETDNRSYLLWQAVLLVLAFAPDIDYLVRWLNKSNHGGVRITHSIAFGLAVTAVGAIFLAIFNRKNVARGALQIFLVVISHLVLDALVGSWLGDPWFYPFSETAYRLPFGILPSAGRVGLTNFYFYRNLLIECGIFVPASCLVLHFAGKMKLSTPVIAGLLLIFTTFLIWSISLSR